MTRCDVASVSPNAYGNTLTWASLMNVGLGRQANVKGMADSPSVSVPFLPIDSHMRPSGVLRLSMTASTDATTRLAAIPYISTTEQIPTISVMPWLQGPVDYFDPSIVLAASPMVWRSSQGRRYGKSEIGMRRGASLSSSLLMSMGWPKVKSAPSYDERLGRTSPEVVG